MNRAHADLAISVSLTLHDRVGREETEEQPAARWAAVRFTTPARPEGQRSVLWAVADLGHRYDVRFLIWFVCRDHDALWTRAQDQAPDTLVLWRDCGLPDVPAPALLQCKRRHAVDGQAGLGGPVDAGFHPVRRARPVDFDREPLPLADGGELPGP